MSLQFVTEPDRAARRNGAKGCDLHQLIGRALDRAAEGAARRGMAMTLRLDEALHAARMTDPVLAATAVSRLADAALASAEGRVSILAMVEGGQVRLDVFSNRAGGGRAGEAAVRAAAEAARALDGRLEVAPARNRLAWSLIFPAPTAKLKVLAIDDDPSARIELSAALDAAGYLPQVCNSREATAAIWTGGPHACVLIDLYLENADALQLAGMTPSPAFALTNGPHAISRWALRQAGFKGLFVKPARMDRLQAALKDLDDQSMRPNS
jgi:CheY-like chemotaxis protein